MGMVKKQFPEQNISTTSEHIYILNTNMKIDDIKKKKNK